MPDHCAVFPGFWLKYTPSGHLDRRFELGTRMVSLAAFNNLFPQRLTILIEFVGEDCGATAAYKLDASRVR